MLARLGEDLHNLEAVATVAATVRRACFGFLSGWAAALLCGMLLLALGRRSRAVDTYISAAAAVPKYSLAPWLVLWLGIDDAPKIVLTAALVFFPTLIAVRAGARAVDTRLVNMTRVVGAGHRLVVTDVVLPTITPYLIAAFKVTAPRALSGTIVLEMIVGDDGLGYRIRQASEMLDAIDVCSALSEVIVLLAVLYAVSGRVGRSAIEVAPTP